MKKNETKKVDLSFVVSGLSDYTNELSPLIASSIYGANTIASGINVVRNQKTTFTLNTAASTIVLQDGASCGGSATNSTTTFGQQDCNIKPIKYQENLCQKDLETKYLSSFQRPGSNPSNLPFEDFILSQKSDELSEVIESILWRGDDSSGSNNLQWTDGFPLSLFNSGSASVVNITDCATSSVTTIGPNIEKMIIGIPAAIANKSDLAIYMSYSNLVLLKLYLIKTYGTMPLSNFDVDNYPIKSIDYPGFDIEMIGTNGITTDVFYCTYKTNLTVGTDLESDMDLKLVFSDYDDQYRVKADFKLGCAVAYPAYFVEGGVATIF